MDHLIMLEAKILTPVRTDDRHYNIFVATITIINLQVLNLVLTANVHDHNKLIFASKTKQMSK